MRMRHKKWALPELEKSDFYIPNPEDYINIWRKKFVNNNQFHVELGCGKGVFTSEFAYNFPDVNLLAIDLSTDVLGVCARNLKKRFVDSNRNVNNILITAYNIEKIDNILGICDDVERLYINFCNPWSREKHKKRRLTHTTKLEKYKKFLRRGAQIYFKTDDDMLFKDSVQYFEMSGFKINRLTYDLQQENYIDIEPNITTEHQEMFIKEGIKIKFLECSYK